MMIHFNEPREPARNGAEQDVVTKWRKMLCYTNRPRVCAKIKRQIRRRERANGKALTRRIQGES